jgi:hypothetical protein
MDFGCSLPNPGVPLRSFQSVFASSEFHVEDDWVLPQIDGNECLLWYSAFIMLINIAHAFGPYLRPTTT